MEDQRGTQALFDKAHRLAPDDEMRRKCGKLTKTRTVSEITKHGSLDFQDFRDPWSIGDSKS